MKGKLSIIPCHYEHYRLATIQPDFYILNSIIGFLFRVRVALLLRYRNSSFLLSTSFQIHGQSFQYMALSASPSLFSWYSIQLAIAWPPIRLKYQGQLNLHKHVLAPTCTYVLRAIIISIAIANTANKWLCSSSCCSFCCCCCCFCCCCYCCCCCCCCCCGCYCSFLYGCFKKNCSIA